MFKHQIKPLAYCKYVIILLFLTVFREDIVILLWKSEDKNCMNNSKPITLTNTFDKIVEKSIKHRFTTFFNIHNLMNHHSNRSYHYFMRKNRYRIEGMGIFHDLAKALDNANKKFVTKL